MADRKTVKFHYIKSPFFRTMHVDGMIGGLTPQGNVHLAFYSERPAIPLTSEHEMDSDGTLSDGVQRGKEGFVREMDCDLVMSRSVVVALAEWLNDKVKEFQLMDGRDAVSSPKDEVESR